jgi:lipid-A-disaccharide synthase-like uncharacterized protein
VSALQVAGWVGNACFFSRFLVQWLRSERAGRSVAPPLFWWLSLAGSALLGAYAVRGDRYVLLVGFVVNGGIYARNLWIQGHPLGRPRRGGAGAGALAVLAVFALAVAGAAELRVGVDRSVPWLACAGLGQLVWSTRFVVQWWFTERRGESHFPASFWWLSLAGNALLLAYAAHLADPIFIAGYLPGPILQIRNLMLGSRRDRAVAQAG